MGCGLLKVHPGQGSRHRQLRWLPYHQPGLIRAAVELYETMHTGSEGVGRASGYCRLPLTSASPPPSFTREPHFLVKPHSGKLLGAGTPASQTVPSQRPRASIGKPCLLRGLRKERAPPDPLASALSFPEHNVLGLPQQTPVYVRTSPPTVLRLESSTPAY